ncbi:MAG TPA: OmpA family protein [Bacteroidales bacterium]|nr:OmpA family protein [Bacteroidales bacterium]
MNRLIYSILFFFIISGSLYAQQYSTKSKKAIENLEKGRQYYQLYKYEEAVAYLSKAIEIDPDFSEAYFGLAQVYTDMKEYKNAAGVYEKGMAIDPDFYPAGYFYMGKVEMKTGDYESAKKSFQKFLDINKGSKFIRREAENGIVDCKFAIKAIQHPVPFSPKNLGANVNSNYDAYWPSLSADEQTLVFTVLLPVDTSRKAVFGNRQEDFYISHRTDSTDGWTEAENMGKPLNTANNEGAQAISADGQMMVFTACNRRDGQGNCDLYMSHLEGNHWSVPVNMGRPVNTAAKETQPSISPDKKEIYFSSNRPGGRGGLDLWKTSLQPTGSWGKPVNLGDTINTPGNEQSPFIHPDNQTLYFSSDTHVGMGGFDLYVTRKDSSGRWQTPINLGYPINTWNDEIGLIVNARGDKAYFSSDREKGKGKDLYEFELYKEARPEMVSYVKGIVFDTYDRKRLEANFELIDLESGETVNQSKSNPLTGEFIVSLPVNKNYALNVSKTGYLFYSDNFSLKGIHEIANPFVKNIPLKRIKVGEKAILRNIFFATDSYALKPESKVELNKLVDFLKNNPGIKIEIGGHTDSIGTETYNQILSENRAKSVRNYLVDHSIDPERLTYKGYGYSQPVNTNATASGRAQNRRTEFRIIATDEN